MNERYPAIANLAPGQHVSLLAIVEHVYGTPAQDVAYHTVHLRLPDGQRLETNVRNLTETSAGPRVAPTLTPPAAPPAAPSGLPAHALAAIAAAQESEANAVAADTSATGRGGRRR